MPAMVWRCGRYCFEIIKHDGDARSSSMHCQMKRKSVTFVCKHGFRRRISAQRIERIVRYLRVGDCVMGRKKHGSTKYHNCINWIEYFYICVKIWIYTLRYGGNAFNFLIDEVVYCFKHREEDLLPMLLKMVSVISGSDIATGWPGLAGPCQGYWGEGRPFLRLRMSLCGPPRKRAPLEEFGFVNRSCRT